MKHIYAPYEVSKEEYKRILKKNQNQYIITIIMLKVKLGWEKQEEFDKGIKN